MPNKKISQMDPASTLQGPERMEILQNGQNLYTTPEQLAEYVGSGITREFNRTFSETLIFDKNEIFHSPVVQSGPINLEIGPGGLVNQSSGMRFRMTMNGTDPVNFGAGFDFLYGITNGQILEAGTYEFYFLYTNGSVSVNVPGVTSEGSTAVVLAVPANFAAVANGENDIDLSWDDVSGESSYLIEVSTTGTGGWSTLSSPAANATTASQSGLSAGDTRFYRMKAVGDGVATLDSGYTSVISAQTEDLGDITDPVPTFSPASGVTTWPMNRPITITLNEPIRNLDGTPIVSDQAGIITIKQTNSGGADIAHSWTIDGTATIIEITPDTHFGDTQLVYWAINNIEDVNGNDVTVALSSTFTTTDYTFFNVDLHNRLQFGDILDSVWSGSNFWLELTVQNLALSAGRPLVTKYDTAGNQRSFQWYYMGTDVYFGWVGHVNGSFNRLIKWTGVFGAGVWVLKYDGTINTNDGLDRVILSKDGVTQGSKSMATTNGVLASSNIPNSTAQLAVGGFVNNVGTSVGTNFFADEAKDFIVRSNAGATVEINVPNLVDGTDTSGNGHNGIWVNI